MSRHPPSMFRGTELPRLLLLVAILLVGAPMVLVLARPRADDPPPPRPLTAAEIRPVVPDDGVEFQALTDKTPVQPRESAAYAELLRRARETPPAKLAASARRDILFTHLWDRPERHRGVPIHIEGTARRILTYEVNPGLAPGKRLFEAWVYSDENRVFPYVLIFEQSPPTLPIGPEVSARVTFDGYFMKLLRYTAADRGDRAAPMLVGRLASTPAPAPAPAPAVEVRDFARRNALTILVALLLGYFALRLFFQIRRLFAPSRSADARKFSDSGRSPEEVAEWLRNLPDESDDDTESVDEPGPRPR